jgi:hypothetical protein
MLDPVRRVSGEPRCVPPTAVHATRTLACQAWASSSVVQPIGHGLNEGPSRRINAAGQIPLDNRSEPSWPLQGHVRFPAFEFANSYEEEPYLLEL